MALVDRADARTILALGGPIMLGMASQTVMNLVDTAMVGRLGPAAQGAAGLGGFAFWVQANLLLGLGAAVQAMVARRDGEGRPEEAGSVLDNGLLLALVFGLPVGYVLGQTTPWLFPLLSDDPDVVEGGALYLQLRLMGLAVVVANYCFRGFYNGISQSRSYMVSLVVIHVANILFNWIFIFGELGVSPMGVRGAGMASALAAAVGTCFYTALTASRRPVMERFRPFRFRSLRPAVLRTMGRLAWPESLRGIALMVGYLLFLRIHSEIGVRETAAGTILVNISSIGFLPALGMGLASATLLGRSLGEGEPDRGRSLVRQAVVITTVGLTLPSALFALFPDPLLTLFTPDGAMLELARPAMRVLAVSVLFDGLSLTTIISLQGVGATRWVAGAQLVQQYLLLLPLGWLLGVTLGWGLTGLWIAMALSRALMIVPAWWKLRDRSWESIEV